MPVTVYRRVAFPNVEALTFAPPETETEGTSRSFGVLRLRARDCGATFGNVSLSACNQTRPKRLILKLQGSLVFLSANSY